MCFYISKGLSHTLLGNMPEICWRDAISRGWWCCMGEIWPVWHRFLLDSIRTWFAWHNIYYNPTPDTPKPSDLCFNAVERLDLLDFKNRKDKHFSYTFRLQD